MNIPRSYQRRLNRARRRRAILALGFFYVDLQRRHHASGRHSDRNAPIHVYLARDEQGRIKIGSSFDPRLRARALRADLLAVIPDGGGEFEAFLHHYFEGFRIVNEWFEDVPQIAAFVRRVNDVFPMEVA